MRLNPEDGDTLFQVGYVVLAPVDSHPIGARQSATFARNWLEASHMVRTQFGEEKADRIMVADVYTRERERGGAVTDHFHYQRYRPDRPPTPLPALRVV